MLFQHLIYLFVNQFNLSVNGLLVNFLFLFLQLFSLLLNLELYIFLLHLFVMYKRRHQIFLRLIGFIFLFVVARYVIFYFAQQKVHSRVFCLMIVGYYFLFACRVNQKLFELVAVDLVVLL